MRTLNPFTVYLNAVAPIAQQHDLTEVLAGVYWALKNNAEDFPVIPGYKTLRMVKTDPVRGIPPLRIIFRIVDDEEVSLNWIEVANSDEYQGPPIL
jgi:hypothetical protein